MTPASVAPETWRFYLNQPISFGANKTPGFIVGPQESQMRYWNVKANDDQKTILAVHLYGIYDDIVSEVVEEQHQVITSEIELQNKDVVDVSVEGDLLSRETKKRGTLDLQLISTNNFLLKKMTMISGLVLSHHKI